MTGSAVAVLLGVVLLPLSSGCFRGIDTIRITTEPPGAKVHWTGHIRHQLWLEDIPRRRRDAGETPTTFPAPWFVFFGPPFVGGQSSFDVSIERPGYAEMKVGFAEGRRPRFVTSKYGSEFGWGRTYEYHFKLQENASGNDLVDIREAARLLHVSPVTVFKWMGEGLFPEPVTPPRDERSGFGAQWRRSDIETYKKKRAGSRK